MFLLQAVCWNDDTKYQIVVARKVYGRRGINNTVRITLPRNLDVKGSNGRG